MLLKFDFEFFEFIAFLLEEAIYKVTGLYKLQT